MNILMIYPQPDQNKHPRFGFSYEMLLIATILSKYHNLTIKDYSCERRDDQQLMSQVMDIDLVLVECDSFALKRSENLVHADWILKICSGIIPTIAYGNYCYITKRQFSNATYTIYENDINRIIDLVNCICKSTVIPQIKSYDELPFINRELLKNIDYYKDNGKNTLLQTAKGCENTCIFCQRKGWQNHYVYHSDEYVLEEMTLIKSQGYKNIWITDENFTFNLNRAKKLLKKIIAASICDGLNIFISSWANIDEEFLLLASKCHIKIISFGIESGNQDILTYYRKNIKLDTIPRLMKYANELGIFIVGNFIIGAPTETTNTVTQTFDFIRKCGFDQVNIKTLDYMIGSELYDSLDDSLKKYDHVFASKEFGLTSLDTEEIQKLKKDFLNSYYREHGKSLKEKIDKYGPPYEQI